MSHAYTEFSLRSQGMSLNYGFNGPSDLFEKLKRDAALLYEEVTGDRFFNFVVTGYSLVDWVINNPDSSKSIKANAEAMRKTGNVGICRDLANASKHFKLNYRPVTDEANSEQGAGSGRAGMGGAGVGEEEIQIIIGDTSVDCLELVDGIVAEWDEFFKTHPCE